MLEKNGANENNPSRRHRQGGTVENSTAKMALTQGPSALRSRALRILAQETREIPHTDYYMTWSSASAHRLLCDLKFCGSASTHGIFFGLKFRLRTRNILRLKVPQFRFRIQNTRVVWEVHGIWSLNAQITIYSFHVLIYHRWTLSN